MSSNEWTRLLVFQVGEEVAIDLFGSVSQERAAAASFNTAMRSKGEPFFAASAVLGRGLKTASRSESGGWSAATSTRSGPQALRQPPGAGRAALGDDRRDSAIRRAWPADVR